ncbi:ribosomal maturation YjgA family protein [Streptomyces sp. NPDC002644]
MTSTATCPPDDRVTVRRTRSRLLAAGAAVVVVCAGLGLRAVAGGDVAKYGGVALYTLMVMTLWLVVAPASSAPRAASVALAVSWAVEFLQLTGVPAELAGRSVLARLVLGSTFHAPDLFWYVVGAVAGWAALVVARRTATPP